MRDLSRVAVHDRLELEVTQGADEALAVEADADIHDRIFCEIRNGELMLRLGRDWMERLPMGLHTSLTRPRIRYSLVAKNLSGLAMFGHGWATTQALTTSAPALTRRGARPAVQRTRRLLLGRTWQRRWRKQT